jgi:hypothetical protein
MRGRVLSPRERTLWSVLVLGVLVLVVGGSAYSAFSVTTVNEGNEFATGTVVLEDDGSGTPMFEVRDARPGQVVERCITVVYTGTVPATVRLHGSPVGALGDHLRMTITAGSLPGGTPFPSCTGFVDAGPGSTFVDSTLGAFSHSATSFETGLPVGVAERTRWRSGDAVVFRFRLTVDADAPQGMTTGEHGFTWTARS